MEFIEYGSFKDDEIPQPQSALPLSLPKNIENISLKFSNIPNIRNLLKFDDDQVITKSDEISENYAKVALELVSKDFGKSYNDQINGREEGGLKYLSDKLSKVLNNSVDDSLIRELFSLELNETELIDSGLAGNLSRRNLRSKIETNLIKNYTGTLKEYQPMIKNLKLVGNKLENLNRINDINNVKLNDIFTDLQKFNNDFKFSNDEKVRINLKKSLLSSFKKKFLLNEFEEFVIQNNEINNEFFNVLDRLNEVNESSSILLSVDDSNLGIKIIERLNNLVMKCNEKLYNFAKRALNNPNLNNEKLLTLKRVLMILKSQSLELYNDLIQDFSDDRSKVLIEEFNRQLTNNEVNSDPVRYIGDFLASLHVIVLNEIELVNSMFMNDKEQQQILVNLILQKISKQLKSNFEVIISMELNFKTIYSIFDLFDLYKLIFDKKFNNDNSNSLIITLNELSDFCQFKLLDLLDNKLKSIKASNLAKLDLTSDLQPPEWLVEFLNEILPIIEQSKINFNSILHLKDDKLKIFLYNFINEPIKIFHFHMLSKDFTMLEKLILEVNFLDVMLSKILPINLLNDKIIELNDMIDNLKVKLIDYQYNDILTHCKLENFQNIINMIMPFDDELIVEIYEPIQENQFFSSQEIENVNIAISEYLPNSLIEMQNNFLRLNNPIITSEVCQKGSLKFVKFYTNFNTITKSFLDKTLIWNDLEVATLLGVEDQLSYITT